MFGVRLSKMGSASKLGLIAKAIGILRKYGTDAHIYLPGVGTISGITAGNYLDSAGVTAASVDNPVGLSLDALQAMTLGSELNATLDFTGWVTQAGWSVSSGVASYSGAGGTNTLKDFTLKANTHYLIEIDATVASGGYKLMCGFDTVSATVSTTGRYAARLIRGSNTYFYVAAVGASELSFPRISVREIPGIHATQSTTANKPILRRGLLNQLLYSQNLSLWSSVLNKTITPNVVLAPDGSMTGAKVQTTASAVALISQNLSATCSAQTIAFFVEQGNQATAEFLLRNVTTGTNFDSCVFTFSTGAVVGTGWSSMPIGGGWHLLVYSKATGITAGDSVNVYCGSSGNAETAGDYWYHWRSGMFPGVLTAQQIIDAGGIPLTTTAAASNPAAGKYSWQFDGSNDGLYLNSQPFQSTDDHCLGVAFKLTSASDWQGIFENRNTADSAGTLFPAIEYASGNVYSQYRDDAAVYSSMGFAYTTGTTCVVSTAKKGAAYSLCKNGAQVDAFTSSKGTTTINSSSFGCSPFGHQLGGDIYAAYSIKGSVSAAERLVLDRFLGLLSGVSI